MLIYLAILNEGNQELLDMNAMDREIEGKPRFPRK